MLKKILISIAICLYLTPFVGCTSNNSKEDSAEPYQEVTDLEAVEGVDVTAEPTATSEATVEPVSPIVDNTTEEAANVDTLPEDPLTEVQATESQSIAESSPVAETPKEEVIPPTTIEQPTEMANLPPEPPAPAPVADNFSAPMTETKSVAATSEPSYEAPPKKAKKSKKVVEESMSAQSSIPAATTPIEEPVLQKVIAQPWRDGDILFNSVYFARGGDSYSSISKKIYGNSKKQELLKKGNPGIAKVKAGDAIYYSSPNRPDDETKVLTFAEDNGVAPEVYVAKAGDNLKVVSKKLLGYSGAWKEVWATNSIEGMAELSEGTEIKYWKSSPKATVVAAAPAPSEVAPPAQVAMNEMPPPPQDNMMPPPPQEALNTPPPPPDASAQNSMPPPPPVDPALAAATSQELPPPPPPPVVPQDPPANVVKAQGKQQSQETEVAPEEAIDQETLNMLIALAIVSAGVVAFVIVRKKRKNKEMEQILQNTQVG